MSDQISAVALPPILVQDELVSQNKERIAMREKGVAHREDAAAQREKAAAQREAAVARREDAAVRREKAVVERENVVVRMDEAISRLMKAVKQQGESLDQREKVVAKLELAMAERNRDADRLVDDCTREFSRISKALSDGKRDVLQREKDVAQAQKAIDQRESILDHNEKLMAQLADSVRESIAEDDEAVSGKEEPVAPEEELVAHEDKPGSKQTQSAAQDKPPFQEGNPSSQEGASISMEHNPTMLDEQRASQSQEQESVALAEEPIAQHGTEDSTSSNPPRLAPLPVDISNETLLDLHAALKTINIPGSSQLDGTSLKEDEPVPQRVLNAVGEVLKNPFGELEKERVERKDPLWESTLSLHRLHWTDRDLTFRELFTKLALTKCKDKSHKPRRTYRLHKPPYIKPDELPPAFLRSYEAHCTTKPASPTCSCDLCTGYRFHIFCQDLNLYAILDKDHGHVSKDNVDTLILCPSHPKSVLGPAAIACEHLDLASSLGFNLDAVLTGVGFDNSYRPKDDEHQFDVDLLPSGVGELVMLLMRYTNSLHKPFCCPASPCRTWCRKAYDELTEAEIKDCMTTMPDWQDRMIFSEGMARATVADMARRKRRKDRKDRERKKKLAHLRKPANRYSEAPVELAELLGFPRVHAPTCSWQTPCVSRAFCFEAQKGYEPATSG